MNILVVNSGSSSIKFQIIETDLSLMQQDADRRLGSGMVERISGHALITLNAEGYPPLRFDQPVRDPREAIDLVPIMPRWYSVSAVRSQQGVVQPR